jgi:hypothetical protein
MYTMGVGIALMWGLNYMSMAEVYSYKGKIGTTLPEGILEEFIYPSVSSNA